MQCSYEQAIKIAADDITKLREADVYRVLDWHPQLWPGLPDYIKTNRPDLATEVDAVLKELGTI